MEPKYPAAIDRYVDLGCFYDLTAAKIASELVCAHTREYQSAYASAYRYLRAARQIECDALTAVQKTFDHQRAERRVDGIVERELSRRGAEEGRTQKRFLGSITYRGAVWRFDSVDALCPKVYEFLDRWEVAGELLERLRKVAAEKGWDQIACVAPEDPSRMEHLLIPGLGLAFVTSKAGMEYGKKPFRRIHLDAMSEPVGKAKIRFQMRVARMLREEGIQALREAKKYHDQLEQVYNPYVDFDGVRALAAIESGRWLSYRA